MRRATDIIRSEHRSLNAILHGLLYLVRQIRDHGHVPDFVLLRAMLQYIEAVLDRLHAEQGECKPLLVRMQESLQRLGSGVNGAFADFDACVQAYVKLHWQHMRCEEDLVLPLADERFTEADWLEINLGFASNTDPVESAALFHQIAARAPAVGG